MDLIAGISAATQAIALAKEIKELNRSLDDATFKLMIAELTEHLADAKIAFSEAKLTLAEKNEQIAELERKITEFTKGEICPKCRTGTLEMTSSRTPRMQAMALGGIQEWQMECQNESCDYKGTKLHDPNGFLAQK